MKNIYTLIILLLVLPFATKAFNPVKNVPAAPVITAVKSTEKKPALTYRQTKKQWEKNLGRKLSFKEKLALRLYNSFPRYDPTMQRKANNQAVTGFIFSLCGLLLLWPLLIPGIIMTTSAMNKEKIDPGILTDGNYDLAKAGFIVSIVGLALVALAIVIVAAFLATGIYI